MSGLELKVDPVRFAREELQEATGIFVRAQLDGKWGSHDCVMLDAVSFRRWIRSRGGVNPFAEDILGLVLAYGRLSELPEDEVESDIGDGKLEAKLYLSVEFDPEKTDAESIATALDKLMDTALSTLGAMDEYGAPGIGKFFVEKE